MKTEEVFTPFEADILAKYGGGKKFPEVFYNGAKIPYLKYQLAVHKYELSLYSKGMKPTRDFKISNYKKYYGLKGRNGTEILNDFLTRIWEKYK